MAPRYLLRVSASAVVAALTLGSGLTAAHAAATPGWRIVKVYGAPAGYPILQGVTASGRGDAWVSGTTVQSLVIDHWNGAAWKQLAVPGTFTIGGSGGVNDGVIGAASAGDVWTFPSVNNGTSTVQYALHWNNGRWQSFRLTGNLGIFGTAVFSTTDAWAFGQAPTKHHGLGFGAPYVVRYNGRGWRRVTMPGTAALGVSPLSADDIWAFGPNAKTAGLTNQVVIGMHWNGRVWSSLSMPTYKIAGKQAIVMDAIAVGPRSLWALEGLPANPGTGLPAAPGLVIAHWNGLRWKPVVTDPALVGQGGLVADGHGGLWLQAASLTSLGHFVLLHYSGGRLAKVAEPTLKGFTTGGISGMVLIPRTISLWATGSVVANGVDIGEGAIFKYGR